MYACEFKHQKITVECENLRCHCFHISWDILGYPKISQNENWYPWISRDIQGYPFSLWDIQVVSFPDEALIFKSSPKDMHLKS